MKKLLKKSLLFSIPFVLFGLLLLAIDPFNYFHMSKIIPDEVKARVSGKVNYRLWKMIQYNQNPTANILLGDSRMILIDAEYITDKTAGDYYNFAYGGGSLTEMIETFWFADSIIDLKSVYIGINFHLFNKYHTVNEVEKIKAYFENPFLYLIDKVVIKAGALCVADYILGIKTMIEKPPMTEEQFWQYQLEHSAYEQFKHYGYPDENYRKLEEITVYCEKNNIELSFIIFPEHMDLINRYYELGLKKQFFKFKDDIARLGRTYDFDFENEMTLKRENFTDPYHFTESVSRQLINEIW
jgi:hypothetical protein